MGKVDQRTDEHHMKYIGRRVRLERDEIFPDLVGEEGEITGRWDTGVLGQRTVTKVKFDSGEELTFMEDCQLRLL